MCTLEVLVKIRPMDFIHCNSRLYISVDDLHFLTFPGQPNPTKHLSENEHDHLEMWEFWKPYSASFEVCLLLPYWYFSFSTKIFKIWHYQCIVLSNGVIGFTCFKTKTSVLWIMILKCGYQFTDSSIWSPRDLCLIALFNGIFFIL